MWDQINCSAYICLYLSWNKSVRNLRWRRANKLYSLDAVTHWAGNKKQNLLNWCETWKTTRNLKRIESVRRCYKLFMYVCMYLYLHFQTHTVVSTILYTYILYAFVCIYGWMCLFPLIHPFLFVFFFIGAYIHKRIKFMVTMAFEPQQTNNIETALTTNGL